MPNTDGSLNILFVQNSPCIRNYKMASALRSRGHHVSLAYSDKLLSQMYAGLSDTTYNECIRLNDDPHLWDLSKNYDVVHCHNEPDMLSVAALAGSAPVIHDTHDLISLRDRGDPNLSYFEGLANRGAAGRVYSTPYQMEEARRLYGVDGPSLVFYNYASESDLPPRYLPKLSRNNGETHIVYEGGIGGSVHRSFADLFVELAHNNIHVHIFPARFQNEHAEYFSRFSRIRYYAPVSPKKLIETMSQFDFGIIPFKIENGNKRFLDSTIANKLFEYLAAGLPVVTSPLKSYIDFFSDNPVGLVFNRADDIVQNISRLREIARQTDFSQQIYTYEKEIGDLIDFYHTIIGRGSESRGREVSLSSFASINTGARKPPMLAGISPLAKHLQDVIIDLDNWIGQNGWAGFDPYDVKAFLLRQQIKASIPQAQIDQIKYWDEIHPEEIRRKLGIEPQINAKGMALFLNAYAQLNHLIKGNLFTKQITSCSDWLLNNAAENMHGLGWGYPFDWESVVIIPAGTPTSVNSYHAGDAFWELYRLEEKDQWLDLCVRVADFFAKDLNLDEVDDNRVCFSYTPLDYFHVHNANLCVAEFLIRIGKEIQHPEFVGLGEKAVQFAVSDFSKEGYLTYWARGYEPAPSNVDQIDHYHTAAELRSLFRLTARLPNRTDIRSVFERYLEFYLNHFFEKSKIPKIHPQRLYPMNIHAAAEAAYILGEIAPHYPEGLNVLSKFLPWFLDNCRNEDGSFIYTISEHNGNQHINRFPFIRWGQAWTLRGLTSALTALTEIDADFPSPRIHETVNVIQ